MTDAAPGRWRGLLGLLAGGLAMAAGALAALADEPMRIVGVPSLERPMRAVADRLVKASLTAPPAMQFGKTTEAVAAFCRSWQKDTPSVLALSRRLRIHEADLCALYGVSEIVEIQLGYQALVLVAGRSDDDLDLRLQDLRAAVAKEIPEGEGFVANPHRTWREVNAKLPAVP
ncbi:MAG: hypothetical protein IT561_24010, partial [Alphaproteobacteria bacterium]|nr:hypothetical protein [Alphaproteobacteria bacterium]